MRLLGAASAMLAIVHSTLAQDPLENFSFGHKGGSISPSSFTIPGFSLLGVEYMPQLLSDKVVMTPPFGGNKRGALWTENKNTLSDWKANFRFRVAVTDQGSGSLQLWYAADGKDKVGTASVSSVSRFDGLAILIDTVNGKQKIRGFLNDGSKDYKSEANIDSLAFGHCDYTYRNRGDPSVLTIKSSSLGGLDVSIDGQPCFSTESIRLPPDYHFGMTASSGDPPDSFEVFGFSLSAYTPTKRDSSYEIPSTPGQNANQHQQKQPASPPNTGSMPPAAPQQNLAALESRLDKMQSLLDKTSSNIGIQFEQLFQKLNAPIEPSPNSRSNPPTQAQIATLDARINDLANTIRSLEKELKAGDHSKQFEKLSAAVGEVHKGVIDHVPGKMREYMIAHTPRIGFILYSFMAFQCCCAAAWGWYRWRKGTMPKKYL
jgi:lectin, mannose-binding 1